MSIREAVGGLTAAATLVACAGRNGLPVIPYSGAQNATRQAEVAQQLILPDLPTPIEHVIIVVQENRTPDYLFQGIPGADISKYGFDSKGKRIALREVSLTAPYELKHSHRGFLKDYDNGKMDGFDVGNTGIQWPFAYGPESELKPYHDMARQYVLADHMFQSNEGPSYPAHLFLISGASTDSNIKPYFVRDNPYNSKTNGPGQGGCDDNVWVRVHTMDPKTGGEGPALWPCFDPPVLSDFLDKKGISWRYYQQGSGAGLWHAFDSVKHVRYGSDYANVIPSSAQFLSDVAAGTLAGVTWLMPADQWSDHSFHKGGTAFGPSWVAAVVNAVGESKFWKSTAILVTWDDWGGWYDHVPPPVYNNYELGFRVPLLVISPYARQGYVSKKQHEFGSLLAFTEETFGIPKGSLNTSDRRADDLQDAFDFTQKPRAFQRIKAPPFKFKGNATHDEDP